MLVSTVVTNSSSCLMWGYVVFFQVQCFSDTSWLNFRYSENENEYSYYSIQKMRLQQAFVLCYCFPLNKLKAIIQWIWLNTEASQNIISLISYREHFYLRNSGMGGIKTICLVSPCPSLTMVHSTEAAKVHLTPLATRPRISVLWLRLCDCFV